MKNHSDTASTTNNHNKKPPNLGIEEEWFDDACILDMDYFVKTITGIKAKGVRADLIGSIIANYASKWLPDLSSDEPEKAFMTNIEEQQPLEAESVTSSWMKKRFFIETLVGILPTEKGSVPCNFLLHLLRIANMVGVDHSYRVELEKRISWQLDSASLKELMIPSFNHTVKTLLDVELFTRLVKRFLILDGGVRISGVGSLIKVARLVDSYLAEAALDSNLLLSEFIDLAGALPVHARSIDDGLYRAIDTYLKAHPRVTKPERKLLWRLIDCQKLSPEATIHASQNDRLPVRAVLQVLFTEQSKLHKLQQLEWSGYFSGITRSPVNTGSTTTGGGGLVEQSSARCLSKREVTAQQAEIRKLKDDISRLQNQCNFMQGQLERVLEKKKAGFFVKWKKIGMIHSFRNLNMSDQKSEDLGTHTPAVDMKTRLVKVKGKTPPRYWRKSMS